MHLTPTAISAALLLAPLVAAHGILVSPAPRAGQGIAPGPKFAVFPPPADLMALCGNNNTPGPVSATFTAGEAIPVKWAITIAHVSNPGVTISIKYNPGDQFQPLVAGLDVNSLTSTVTLPADKVSDNAVLQWTWASQADGGFYLECADIAVKAAAVAPPNAPEPTVVAAPAPTNAPAPTVVAAPAPAPEPPVVAVPTASSESPVVTAPAPEPPVVAAPTAPATQTSATETAAPSAPPAPTDAIPAAPTAEGATSATEFPVTDCTPEESAPAQAPAMPGMPAPMPTYSAPAAEYPQTAPAQTGSTSVVFSSALSSKVVSGVASALVVGVAALLTL
ncbi:hypothetical protein HDU87_001533 [Geranomyces variabilis]|uniref:Chitin-binding type-4 domain-containing protein n=1 Tax=Geranomyces variabilis TaxID=109894 RepID=A0AAD5XP83_9FUNG|nr:hypothetical protein HDU87_001533 [Geranomyces variabilis]